MRRLLAVSYLLFETENTFRNCLIAAVTATVVCYIISPSNSSNNTVQQVSNAAYLGTYVPVQRNAAAAVQNFNPSEPEILTIKPSRNLESVVLPGKYKEAEPFAILKDR